ncbi:MAG: hypothetical protein ACRCXT_00045 [Paraclostridium sp.]
MFIKVALQWILSYILKRATGGFIEWLLDYSLVEIAKRTDNKLDDAIVDKFVQLYKHGEGKDK